MAETFYYLRRHGYIELIPQGEDMLMKLTQKGKERVVKMNYRRIKISRNAKWDNNWWFVIADIPTELRTQANLFRKKLKELGLFTLQRSVWVYPFDPRNELAFIAKTCGLEQYITTFKAQELESEDEYNLKNFFKGILK